MAHTESSDKKTTATVTIDGNQITVPVGTTILEAAAQLDIKIPTLCWLKKISTTGACRICVVKVEGVERFMTACNTPVKDGLVVITSTPEIEVARKKTLELMLVNHPLDCPICDAAGECDLQDTCYGLQVDKNKYTAELERLPIRYDWKLLESDPNRCILCEKCVKVCREIVGREAIEIVDRGDRTIIDTITGEALNCDFCGNCVNACPTGTLISKPFKFRGRPWSFTVTPGICAFCSSGCEIEYHSLDNRIERVTSSDDTFNRGNLCVNGRFGYGAFNSPGRLSSPLVKDASNSQHKTDWDQALSSVSSKLKEIIARDGGAAVAGIASPRATNEDNYLFQKFMRAAVGTNNIDSEARLGYFPSQIRQWEMLGFSGGSAGMDAIEKAATILIVGADLKAESAGFAYRVIHASLKNNAKVVLASSRASSLTKFANSFLQYRSGSDSLLTAGLIKALFAEGYTPALPADASGIDALRTSIDALTFEKIAEATGVTEQSMREAARLLGKGGPVAVIYGAELMRSTDACNAVTGVVNLALLTGADIFPIDEKNNTQGMLDMGICPEYLPGYHTYEHGSAPFAAAWNCSLPLVPGKNLFQIIEGIEKGEIKALYVMGSDLLHIMPNRTRTLQALEKLELLVVQDALLTETARLAHVVLPAAIAPEKSGSFTTVDNRTQCFKAAVAPPAECRTDSDILRKLHGMVAQIPQITPQSLDELHHEITTLTGLYRETCDHDGCRMGRAKTWTATAKLLPMIPAALAASSYPYLLAVGSILHHNGTYTTWSDNNTLVAAAGSLAISSTDATKLGIVSGDKVKVGSALGSVILPVVISSQLQPGLLFVPNHTRELHINTLMSGPAPEPVTLEKA